MTRRRLVAALLCVVGVLVALTVVPAAFVTDSCSPADRSLACGPLGRHLAQLVLVAGIASVLLAFGAFAARRWRPFASAAAVVELVALVLVAVVVATMP